MKKRVSEFQNWLKTQCEKRAENPLPFTIFEHLRLNDGLVLSVQASYLHYCTPRKNLRDGNYETVEVCTFNMLVPELEKYRSDIDDVCADVPIKVLDFLVEKHGGINEKY